MKRRDDVTRPENVDSAMAEKVWNTFQKSFSQVQPIFDQNRLLIKEISQNHASKMPENLTRNVALIRELNRNIACVVELYSNLSSEFVQSLSENPMEEVEVGNQTWKTTDRNGSNSPAFAGGQKKLRCG